jgi:hypothetical protein
MRLKMAVTSTLRPIVVRPDVVIAVSAGRIPFIRLGHRSG